jgi:hypothetical protein
MYSYFSEDTLYDILFRGMVFIDFYKGSVVTVIY